MKNQVTNILPGKVASICFCLLVAGCAVGACVYDYLTSPVPGALFKRSVQKVYSEVQAVVAPILPPAVEPEPVGAVSVVPEVEPDPVASLKKGLAETEVLELLGEPTGRMSMKDRSVWTYDGQSLEFKDGTLLTFTSVPVEESTSPGTEDRMPIEESIAAQLSSVKGWFFKMTKDTTVKRQDIILANDEGSATHEGNITVVDYHTPGVQEEGVVDRFLKKVFRKETEIVLRKIEKDDG
jgi:hypothetical protein